MASRGHLEMAVQQADAVLDLVRSVDLGAVGRSVSRMVGHWIRVQGAVRPPRRTRGRAHHTHAILATCERHWRALAPLHRWLTHNVKAS
jgi:hypothetical protein